MQNQKFKNVFPSTIDFYGVGRVNENSEQKTDIESFPNPAIAVRLVDSDFLGLSESVQSLGRTSAGVCLFQFSSEPKDASMAQELANILAARVAAAVSKEIGSQVLISPPEAIEASDKSRASANAISAETSRIYFFQGEGESFHIRMVFIPPVTGIA